MYGGGGNNACRGNKNIDDRTRTDTNVNEGYSKFTHYGKTSAPSENQGEREYESDLRGYIFLCDS